MHSLWTSPKKNTPDLPNLSLSKSPVRFFGLGLVVWAQLSAACSTDDSPSTDTSTSGTPTDSMGGTDTEAGTDDTLPNTENTGEAGTAGESGDSESSDAGEAGTGGDAPLGTICENDSECESGKCYIVYWWYPEPYGTCSLCNSDDDCTGGKNGAGTCGLNNPLDPEENYNSCQDGSRGHICQPESTGCEEGLKCADVFADSPMACSECQIDADCGGDRLCDASRVGDNGTPRFWLECIDRNSRPNGTPCPQNEQGEGRDEFCMSTHCAEIDSSELPGLPEDFKLHFCGECKTDDHCEEGLVCKQGKIMNAMFVHSTCVEAE